MKSGDSGISAVDCNLIREVKVSRGYELDVVMDMNYEQFLSVGA